MTKKHIIFDLDGTLIDSSPSILAGFAYALDKQGIKPIRPLTPEVVGPPLMQTLTNLTGSTDVELLKSLAEDFKSHYDTEGYKQTIVFDGVPEMLAGLVNAGKQLYIATNKRIYPTRKIIEYLCWESFFAGVYALDYFQPAAKSKQDMIGKILAERELTLADSLYVGDRVEDGLSAEGNRMNFTMVTWGYMDETSGDLLSHWSKVDTPQVLAGQLVK